MKKIKKFFSLLVFPALLLSSCTVTPKNDSIAIIESIKIKEFCVNDNEEIFNNLLTNRKINLLKNDNNFATSKINISSFNSSYQYIKSNLGKYISIKSDKEPSIKGQGGDGGFAFNIKLPEALKGKTVIFGAWVRAESQNINDQSLGIFDGTNVIYGSNIKKDNQWYWSTVKKEISNNADQLLLYAYVTKGIEGNKTDILDIRSPELFLVCY